MFQVSGDVVKAYQSYDRPVKGFLVYPNNNPYFDNDVPDILYNSTNLTATFANVASRLTVQLRDSSDAVHSGLEEKFILHIQVEWSFFVLLILTLVLGSVYFVGILIQTHRLGLPAWKESTYPVLAYGFKRTDTIPAARGGTGDVQVTGGEARQRRHASCVVGCGGRL